MDTKDEFLLEEYKSLRESITKKQDAQLYILAFTLATITTVMGFLLSKEKMLISSVLVLSNFSMFVLLASFIIIIRLIYSIKTIGGYIEKILEPLLFGENVKGWESYIIELNKSDRKSFFILSGGTHLTYSFFYIFMGFSIITSVMVYYKWDKTFFCGLTRIDWLLQILIILLFIFVFVLVIGLNKHAKHWKKDWDRIVER